MTSLAAAFISGAVIEEATVGGFHSCVWNVNNTLACWGDNQQGQLGHGNNACNSRERR